MALPHITDEELVGVGVTGLPDVPGLSTEDMQAQFDEYSVLLKNKFIALIDALEATTGALNIGAEVPTGLTCDANIQSILDALRQYTDDTVVAVGTSDMARSVYDPDVDGVIGPEQGGTGETSLQAARNAMGLGNTSGALPIANGGTGASTVAGARDALGLGNTSGALPIANGGTGANTVALARNALGLGNTAGPLPIANGGTGKSTVAEARNALGLGNTDGALPVANGGTGTTDGTLNGVKLGTSNGKYGYYDGSTFKSFRQPTGNAVAGDVLSGKTFANANSDALTGSMSNYSSSSRRTVTPSGGTGNEQLSLPAGYHDSVIVNRTNPYNAGYNSGYSAGQTAGYSSGYSDGRAQGRADQNIRSLYINSGVINTTASVEGVLNIGFYGQSAHELSFSFLNGHIVGAHYAGNWAVGYNAC